MEVDVVPQGQATQDTVARRRAALIAALCSDPGDVEPSGVDQDVTPTDDTSARRRRRIAEALRAGHAIQIDPAGNLEILEDTKEHGQLSIDVPSATCPVGIN